ncbi:MAG: DUF333 domain-containing protein [Patescibacteria group bacterium]|nr:DUF333 domain-containing protein [Patescibacteria group bacterium]
MSTKLFLPILLILVLAGAGCSAKKPNQEQSSQNASTTVVNGAKDDQIAKDTTLSNPATVYCLGQGGKFSMKKALDGGEEGYCELPNNIQCEEWAFYRGECPSGAKQKSVTSTSDTATSTSVAPATPTTAVIDGQTGEGSQPYRGIDIAEPTTPTQEKNIELSAELGEPGEVVVKWKMNGIKNSDGFLAMLSGTPNAGGYGKYNHELGSPDSRSFTWTDLVAGRTYYFRVCTYRRPECIKWSDEVSAVAE